MILDASRKLLTHEEKKILKPKMNKKTKKFKVNTKNLIGYNFPISVHKGPEFVKEYHKSQINYFQVNYTEREPTSP